MFRFLRSLLQSQPSTRNDRKQPRRLVPSFDCLEERAVMNAAWGANGPPLLLSMPRPAKPVGLAAGFARGVGSIVANEVDYYRFTPAAAGFYRFTVNSTQLDAMVGVYTAGAAGELLGYSDQVHRGAERLSLYLEAGTQYYLGVSNYL